MADRDGTMRAFGRRYGSLLWNRRWLIAALFGLSAALAFCVAVSVYLWKVIYDELFRRPDGRTFFFIVAASIGSTLAAAGLRVAYDYLLAGLEKDLFIAIRNRFVDKVMRFPYAFFLESKSGEFVKRATDDCRLVSGGLAGAVSGILNSAQILFWLVFFWTLKPWVSVLFCVLAALLVVWVLAWRKRQERSIDRIIKANDRTWKELTTVFGAIKLIKLDGLRSRAIAKAEPAFAEFSDSLRENQRLSNRIWSVTTVLPWLAAIAFVLFMAGKVAVGSVSIGLFVFCLLFTDRILSPLNELVNVLLSLQSYRESDAYLRGYEDRDIEREGGRELAAIRRAIEFRGVGFAYGTSNFALRGIDLRIPIGSRVALFGDSGSGKSTVAALLLRLYAHQAGEVLLDGAPIQDFTLESLRRRIVLIPQEVQIFSGPLRGNIDLTGTLGDAELNDIVDRVRLRGFVDGLERGLDTPIALDGLDISGGERQRIGIARALALKGDVVVLDEFSASLDKGTEAEIVNMLFGPDGCRTMLVITHNPAMLQRMDIVYRLAAGTVLESTEAAARADG